MPSPTPRTRPISAEPSKRRVARSRDIWLGLFTDALNALISTDDDRVKKMTEEEAEEIAQSASLLAEAALKIIEERWFPNL